MNTSDYNLSILYVDDEPQALKYFAKAYSPLFRIHTCESAKEALAYLESHSDEVGVLISDQRMPEQTGVSLLEAVRGQYPHIVRILTTAYAELDNAIDAVNDGAVFRYITKPWNINDLKGALKNALDYATVCDERNQLLSEKLSTIQRVLIMERSRYLAVIASSLSNAFRNTSNAVRDYVQLSNLSKVPVSRIKNLLNMDLSLCGPLETKKMTELASEAARLNTLENRTSNDYLNITEFIEKLINESELEIDVESSCANVMLTTNAVLLKNALTPILNKTYCTSSSIILNKINSEIQISLANPLDHDNMVDNMFSILRDAAVSSPIDGATFLAFFCIYHLGGYMTIEESTSHRKLKINLPINQESVKDQTIHDYNWIDDVFDQLESAGY